MEIEPGTPATPHRLTREEVFVVLSGAATVEFADGTRERSAWSGQERYKVFSWPGRRVRAARIDPDRKLTLEARRLDLLERAWLIASDIVARKCARFAKSIGVGIMPMTASCTSSVGDSVASERPPMRCTAMRLSSA